MKTFTCPGCSTIVFFENVRCLDCGFQLAYDPIENNLVQQRPGADGVKSDCENRKLGVCNWNLSGSRGVSYCLACDLNRMIPNLNDNAAFERWGELEKAKHRAVYSLIRFGLPVESKSRDRARGLAFDFLATQSNFDPPVVTGHLDGVITIDVAEADSINRETRRVRLREPYRTLVGHFRHEIGHYYWNRLVGPSADLVSKFRELFGDERVDYTQAIQNYHRQGPRPGWEGSFVTAYSTSHPWEDWAETWAHYFHLVDLLETAREFKVAINPNGEPVPPISSKIEFNPYDHDDIENILDASLGLTLAVNSLNRSVGQPDLYPFAIPAAAKRKLAFVHSLIRSVGSE